MNLTREQLARISDALRQIEAFEFFACELKTRSVFNHKAGTVKELP